MTKTAAPAGLRGIDHACVRVDDFDRAIVWYGETFGFSVENRWKLEQLPGVEIAYLRNDSGFRLEIMGGGEGGRPPVGQNILERFVCRGWNHICFASDDVDATIADLASRGVSVLLPPKDFPEGPNARLAIVQDHEGNLIEFIGPLRHSDGIAT